MNDWQDDLLGDKSMKPPETRHLEDNRTVMLYGKVQDAPFVARTTRLGTGGARNSRDLQRFLPHYKLGSDYGEYLIFIMLAVIRKGIKDVAYPYTFNTNEEVSDSLRDMFTVRYYAWDSRKMVVKPSDTQKPYPV